MEEGTSYSRIELESTERFARLGRELGVTSFGLNVVNLTPGQRMRIHRHATQEEVYIVIHGNLTLAIEGKDRQMVEGEAARVEPGLRRQLVNRGRARCVVLAIGGTGEHASRDAEAFSTWDEQVGRPLQEVPLPPDLSLETGSLRDGPSAET
jgi:uncharacterized cupin superfamily protein